MKVFEPVVPVCMQQNRFKIKRKDRRNNINTNNPSERSLIVIASQKEIDILNQYDMTIAMVVFDNAIQFIQLQLLSKLQRTIT